MSVLDAAGLLSAAEARPWLEASILPRARQQDQWVLAGRERGAGFAALLDLLAQGDDPALTTYLRRIKPEPEPNDAGGAGQIAGAAGLADGLCRHSRTAPGTRIALAIPQEQLITAVAAFRAQTQTPERRGMLKVAASTPVDLARSLAALVPTHAASDVAAALDVYYSHPEELAVTQLVTDLLSRFTDTDPTTPDEQIGSLIAADRARSIAQPEALLGSAADNGTLVNLIAVAQANNWPREAAMAAMLHIVVRPDLGTPQGLRSSATGHAVLQQAMTDPTTQPWLVSEQVTWCRDHKNEALALLVRVAVKQPDFQKWASHVVGALHESGDLELSPEQSRVQWKYIRSVIGIPDFTELTRDMFSDGAAREAILADNDDAGLTEVALGLPEDPDDRASRAALRSWANTLLKATDQAEWDTALRNPKGDPRLNVGLALAGTKDAPSGLGALGRALHPHFTAVINGDNVWQPDAATFAKLTKLLTAPNRRTLASQFCAELEGRDGSVSPGLVATYGDFLAEEATFRTHPKLPNVIERLVAHEQWPEVEWIVAVATRPQTRSGLTIAPTRWKTSLRA